MVDAFLNISCVALDFWLNFNCSAANIESMAPDSVDVELHAFFELNTTMLTGFQKLISMPPLNFTVKYHKVCTQDVESTKIRPRNRHGATSNYLIAYLIIGALGGFSFLIGFAALVMFMHGKLQAKKVHTKYESLHPKLTQEQQLLKHQQQQLINERLKNKVYTKQAGGHKKQSNPYAKRTRPAMNPLPHNVSKGEADALARKEAVNDRGDKSLLFLFALVKEMLGF